LWHDFSLTDPLVIKNTSGKSTGIPSKQPIKSNRIRKVVIFWMGECPVKSEVLACPKNLKREIGGDFRPSSPTTPYIKPYIKKGIVTEIRLAIKGRGKYFYLSE
jgi:hypothetical protein